LEAFDTAIEKSKISQLINTLLNLDKDISVFSHIRDTRRVEVEKLELFKDLVELKHNTVEAFILLEE